MFSSLPTIFPYSCLNPPLPSFVADKFFLFQGSYEIQTKKIDAAWATLHFIFHFGLL